MNERAMARGTAAIDVSVLIATRNRARLLEQALLHLSKQTVGQIAWEVIVVDNGSDDSTPDVLSRLKNALPLVALEEPVPGKNRALNRALASARGRLLLFTDDDIVPDHDWIQAMHTAAARWPERTILAGRITPLFEDGVPMPIRDPAFRYWRLAFCGFRPQDEEGPIEQRAFGPNFAVVRQDIGEIRFCESIGPDEKTTSPMGDETEFFIRLEQQGFKTVFIPAAHVRHVVPPDKVRWRALLQRAFRAGRGDVLLDQRVTEGLIAGVPTFLWKRLAGAFLRCIPSLFFGQLTRLERGMDLWRAYGRVYQYRVTRHTQQS